MTVAIRWATKFHHHRWVEPVHRQPQLMNSRRLTMKLTISDQRNCMRGTKCQDTNHPNGSIWWHFVTFKPMARININRCIIQRCHTATCQLAHTHCHYHLQHCSCSTTQSICQCMVCQSNNRKLNRNHVKWTAFRYPPSWDANARESVFWSIRLTENCKLFLFPSSIYFKFNFRFNQLLVIYFTCLVITIFPIKLDTQWHRTCDWLSPYILCEIYLR